MDFRYTDENASNEQLVFSAAENRLTQTSRPSSWRPSVCVFCSGLSVNM